MCIPDVRLAARHLLDVPRIDHPGDDALLKFGDLFALANGDDVAADQMGVPYLQIDFESVIIADFSISGGIGEIPMENVAMKIVKRY